MSKLIIEMDMPKDCWCCPNGHPDWIYNDDGAAQMVCFCNICNTEEDDRCISEIETERPSWCPIVGVLPPEHGRLIDADDVNNHIIGYVDLRDCPTIVPATERSETNGNAD